MNKNYLVFVKPLDQNDLKLKKLMKKIKNTYCLYTHSLPV